MPVPSIRSLCRRFTSNVRERGGRNGERIGAARARSRGELPSPSRPAIPGRGDRTSGRTGPTATIIALARRRGSQTWRDCDTDPSADLDKIHNTLDVLEDLLFRFIAFGGLRRQPSAAGRKQVFKGAADHGISLKVPADHGESSV